MYLERIYSINDAKPIIIHLVVVINQKYSNIKKIKNKGPKTDLVWMSNGPSGSGHPLDIRTGTSPGSSIRIKTGRPLDVGPDVHWMSIGCPGAHWVRAGAQS